MTTTKSSNNDKLAKKRADREKEIFKSENQDTELTIHQEYLLNNKLDNKKDIKRIAEIAVNRLHSKGELRKK